MEESYSFPQDPLRTATVILDGGLIRTVEKLKDLRRKTRGPIIDNSVMNHLLIASDRGVLKMTGAVRPQFGVLVSKPCYES
jgi:hypothetical protein